MTDTAAENGDSADGRAQADRDGDPLALVKAELAAKDRKLFSLEAALAQREREIRALESTLEAVYASTTWKLGAPLRIAKRLVARIANPAGLRRGKGESPLEISLSPPSP